MNVCMVAYTFYESDNRVRRYAETLARRGDNVEVIALRGRSEAKTEYVNNVRVLRIQKREIDETGPLSYLVRLLRFFVHSMLMLAVRDLRRHYDLIHVHSVPDFEIFAAWFPKLRGAKLILDIHDLVPEFYASKFDNNGGSSGKRFLLFIERLSARFADHVIVANHLWRERLLARSVRNGRCTVILNYPDGLIFRCKGKTRRDSKFVMLYPGTLNYHQGLDLAIRALARIQHQAPHAELHIYGKGDQLNNLIELARALHLENKVQFKDPVSLTEIARIMESADLGVVPKRTDGFGNEAFSTKVPEFMTLGVPVLVSDSAVDRFYFPDDVVEFFRGNSDLSLSECMLDMIRNPEKREAQVKRGNEFIRAFDWEVNKEQYLNLVDHLVDSNVAAAAEHHRRAA